MDGNKKLKLESDGTKSSLATGGENSKSGYSQLTSEILARIFGYLDGRDLLRVRQVCKQWNVTGSDPNLFRSLTINTCKDSVPFIKWISQKCPSSLRHLYFCINEQHDKVNPNKGKGHKYNEYALEPNGAKNAKMYRRHLYRCNNTNNNLPVSEIIELFSRFNQLQSLSLMGFGWSALDSWDLMEKIESSFPNLKILSSTFISCVEPLIGLKALEELHVTNTPFNNENLELISQNFPNLARLNVGGLSYSESRGVCSIGGAYVRPVLTAEFLIKVIESKKDRLKSLYFDGSLGTAALCQKLIECQSLEELCISNPMLINISNLVYLKELRKVNKLIVTADEKNKDGLEDFFNNLSLSALDQLEVCDPNLDASSIFAMIRACRNVRRLSLKGSKDFDNAGLNAVVTYCRNLVELNVEETSVTGEGFRGTAHKLTSHLTVVNLTWSSQEPFDRALLAHLKATTPRLKFVFH